MKIKNITYPECGKRVETGGGGWETMEDDAKTIT